MSDDEIRAGNGGNDLDGGNFDDATGFDDEFGGPSGGRTVGDLFRDSPLVKVGVIVGVLAVVMGIILLFGGEKETRNKSSIGRGSKLSEAPGSEDVTPAYEEAVTDFNITQVEDALKKGESALPVPVGTTRGRIDVDGQQEAAEDPLERWRRIQEERQKRAQVTRPAMPTVDPNAETVNALSKAMAAQMESILGSREIKAASLMTISDVDYIEKQREAKAAAAAQAAANNVAAGVADPAEIILPAGTVEYAQLMIEANSDAPGPVLAQIVSGPLNGSRILGSFKEEEEFLVLTFDQVVIDGVSHPADAVALDPDTTGIGMVTDIDNRYFKRVILPAAAKFIEGMAGAIADTGTSVVVVGDTAVQSEPELDSEEQVYKGLEEAASSVGDMLEDEANKTKRQIKVRAGTPIGILFVEPVLELTTAADSGKKS